MSMNRCSNCGMFVTSNSICTGCGRLCSDNAEKIVKDTLRENNELDFDLANDEFLEGDNRIRRGQNGRE